MALDFLRRALGWLSGEAAALPSAAPEIYRLFLLPKIVVFAAQVNQASFVYPISEVAYDTVTTGAFGDIEVGMTVYFGSSAGAFDLGASRIRTAADATKIYFGRSSQGVHQGEVNLSDNIYITVLSLYEVWSRPPFVAADGTISKDPGLAVEWRTTTPPPVCNIGCGFARTIDSITSLITVALDATGSYATAAAATISSYLWAVDDGTIVTGTTTTSTITVTFPAGFRWVSCTVTDSAGHTATRRIPIFARDPAADACIPFQFESHRITADGQRVAVRPLIDIPAATYPPGTLAMLWKGEPADVFDRSHMILPCAWLGDIPATIEAQRTGTLRDVTLELLDVAARLEMLNAFSQRVEHEDIRVAEGLFPSITWMHMVDLNLDLYVHYLLAWHTSALPLADFFWSGTGAAFEVTGLAGSAGGNMWDQLEERVKGLVPDYHMTCDRLGALRMVVDPMLQDVGDRTATIQATLTAADWSDLRFTHQRHPRIYQLNSAAITAGAAVVADVAADIAANIKPTLPIVFSKAPGDAPGQGGREESNTFKLAVSQSSLNSCEGHRYARINAPQSEFRITLSEGDDQGIDPAHMEWVRLTLPAAVAAQRGLSFTEARGLPKELSIRYNHAREGLTKTVELTWERETSGTAAVTYTPPVGDVPGDDDTWPGDYHGTPPGDVIVPIDVPPLPLYEGQNIVAIIDEYGQIFRTSNFQNATPTWDRKTITGLSGSEKVLSFVVDPFSPLYRGTGSTVNGFVATERFIYRINDMFGTTPTKTELYSFGYVTNPALDRNRVIQASFGRFFPDEADNPWLIVVSHNGTLSGNEGTNIAYSTDAGATWSLSGINLFSDPETGEFREPYIGLYLSPKTPGLAYTAAYLATAPEADGFVSTNWGASWAQISDPDIDPEDGLAGDIHVPWPDNDGEDVVYHGKWQKGATLIYSTFRVEGTGVTNISPSYDSHTWGVNRSHFAIRTYDSDRRYVSLAGIANDTTASFADDVFAAFVSNNYGATWTNIVDTLLKTDPHPEAIAFAADTEQVLFLWGSERYIAYSSNFGATVTSKAGNMPVDFSTDVRDLVGLVGGEAPP